MGNLLYPLNKSNETQLETEDGIQSSPPSSSSPSYTHFGQDGDLPIMVNQGRAQAHAPPEHNIADQQANLTLEIIENFLSHVGIEGNDFLMTRLTRHISETEEMIQHLHRLEEPTKQWLRRVSLTLRQLEIAWSIQHNHQSSTDSRERSNPSRSNGNPPTNGRILRQNEIPKFDGSATNWPSFKTIFTELVGNNLAMSDTYIAYLLASAMPENKRELVASFGDNWMGALNDLTERMENRESVRAELFKIVADTNKLSQNATLGKWQQFLDNLRSVKRRANPFGEIVESQLHIMLAIKLDAYYTSYMEKEHHSSIDDLITFCETKVKMLEDMQQHASITGITASTTVRSNDQRPLATLTSSTSHEIEPCIFCKGDHRRKDCPLSRNDRRTQLRNEKRCYGCFIEFVSGERHHCDVTCHKCRRERMHTIVCPCRKDRSTSDNSNTRTSTTQVAKITAEQVPSSESTIASSGASMV